jgi:von Willebrand factor type A domain
MRKKTTRVRLLLLATLLVGRAALAADQQQPAHGQEPPRHIDLVIALDTSNSMDGLIDSARQKLWDVVNLLAHATPQPVLRVGLISYGNTGYDSSRGWVRKDMDLTGDLDSVYAKLFALRTHGGEEYVARAVVEATKSMQWDRDSKSLRVVFVAGNEPANQDPKVSLEAALADAREHDIVVNTIYCGSPSAIEANGWQQVAALGKGRYAAIDHNRVAVISTPMDAELGRLSNELNKTYVAYGAHGGEKSANQAAQDANASSSGAGVAAGRAQAKASVAYSNEDWDLVDAAKKGKKVAEVKPQELPLEMRNMTAGEREEHVKKKAAERATIQRRIDEVSKQRDAYLRTEREHRAKKGADVSDPFHDAMDKTIREEGKSRGFAF